MRITAVDESMQLYAVEDVITNDLLTALATVNWQNQDGGVFLNQPDADYIQTARRAIDISNNAILKELDRQLRIQQYNLAKQLDLEFSYYYTDYWLDPPGWKVPIHTDLFIPCAWQMYWAGESNTGTTFLWTKDKNDVRYQFEFRPNTGYLVLNMPTNNFQPLHWHGMFEPITQWRFSSYTRLGPYSKISF